MNCPGCNTVLGSAAQFCGACGKAIGGFDSAQPALKVAAVSESTTDLVGREIAGRYRIRALLGAGGMGAVFRAEQISLKRTVALKLLKEELCEEPGIVRRFNVEAELAAKLNHPNTVTLFDFGRDTDGTLFIAMEYVQGQSLRAVLKKGAMTPSRAVAICEQVTASLADAHTFGIVHRDLKPDNVMLSERGKHTDVVTVLDFGIAKLRDRDDDQVVPVTQAGDLLGTPQYMAPEQIRGDGVDGRTDVYALGVMLYEMLTGRVPFTGKTVMAILSKQLTEVPLPPSQINTSVVVDPELEALIMASLHKEPAGRPASMEAVGETLALLAKRLSDSPGVATSPMTPSMMMGPTILPSQSAPIRPPGVPLTSDSFPHPMPQPAATNVDSAPPVGVPRAGRGAVWIVAALLGIALVTVGILFAASGNGKDSTSSTNTSKAELVSLPGVTHSSSMGYKIKIPPGYSIQDSPNSNLQMAGFHKGAVAAIVIAAIPTEQDWTKDRQLQAARDSAKSAGALPSLVVQWQHIQGAERLVGTYTVPQGQKVAFVVFVDEKRAYVVGFATMANVFGSAESLIKELMDQRFQLPRR